MKNKKWLEEFNKSKKGISLNQSIILDLFYLLLKNRVHLDKDWEKLIVKILSQ
jgi:hypothetical protein